MIDDILVEPIDCISEDEGEYVDFGFGVVRTGELRQHTNNVHIQTCIHTDMHTYVHTYIHTYIHNVHIHTYIRACTDTNRYNKVHAVVVHIRHVERRFL